MKRIISIAAAAALIFAYGCSEEPLDRSQEGQDREEVSAEGFSIRAGIAAPSDSRTSFDAATGKVEWSEGDALGIHIRGGETDAMYKFVKNEGADTFSTDEFTPDPETEYTYYAVYPYPESGASDLTAQVSIVSGTYDSSDPDGHIDTPLWGKSEAVAGTETPEITLSHLASVIEVNFVNNTGSDLTVSEVSLEAAGDAALSGTFTLDLETGRLTPAEASASASLTVNASAGASSAYYIACFPYSGDLTVNVAAGGTYSESKSGVNFVAGKFYNTTVTAAGEPELPESVESLSISGAAAGGTPITVEKTLEDETLYAWKGELQAGEFKINVNGTDAFLSVADANFEGIPSGYSIAFDGGSYTVPAAGSYRIIVDTEAATVEVRDEEHDLSSKTVIFKRNQGSATADDNCTVEVEALYIFGDNVYYSGSKPKGDPYILKQSLANPRLFVYKGEGLKEDNIKFCATDNWNNEYAFGSGAERDKDLIVTSGQTVSPIYGGQGNNRYAMFSIPEGVNYIEVYVGPATSDEHENGLSKVFELEGSYVLFEQR